MPKFNSAEILNLKMQANDAGASTIREYLGALLSAVWSEGESFSGKRPFGNSGWEYELYAALVTAGALKGDEDGYPDDKNLANTMIVDAIRYLIIPELFSEAPSNRADPAADNGRDRI